MIKSETEDSSSAADPFQSIARSIVAVMIITALPGSVARGGRDGDSGDTCGTSEMERVGDWMSELDKDIVPVTERVTDGATVMVGVTDGATVMVAVTDGATVMVAVTDRATVMVGVTDGATVMVGVTDRATVMVGVTDGKVLVVAVLEAERETLFDAVRVEEDVGVGATDRERVGDRLEPIHTASTHATGSTRPSPPQFKTVWPA